jgi:hypothetical protein
MKSGSTSVPLICPRKHECPPYLPLFDHRDYDAALSSWKEADPAQYVDGSNRYLTEASSPLGRVDWSGLDSKPTYDVVKEFQVTGINITFHGGGTDIDVKSSLNSLKGNKIDVDLPQTFFDKLPDKLKTGIQKAADDYLGTFLQAYKSSVGDANLIILSVSDTIVAKGTVACKGDPNQTKDVEVEIELDTQTASDPQGWLLPDEANSLILGLRNLFQKTMARSPSSIADLIKSEMLAKANSDDK